MSRPGVLLSDLQVWERLGGPGDASQKLERLTGNRSPLFQLFCEVSENTNVHSEEILKAFQPVRDVVKAPCYSLVAQGYDQGQRECVG
jgi:type VI protein secretion system component VasK